jgi:hypothetical protein
MACRLAGEGDDCWTAWAIVKDYVRRFHKPMPALEFESEMGVRGGARQRLVEGLESKGFIQTVTLERQGRGRPSQGLVPAPSPKSEAR